MPSTSTSTEGAIDLFRFDLETYRADVVVPGAAKPATAAALRRQVGAALVVNGGFFDTEGRPLGLRIADGRKLIGLRAVVDWGVLVLRPGRAAIVHSREYSAAAAAAPAVTGAIQVGPRILVDGRVPGLKPQAARRTAVAIDHGGRFLTVVVANARMQAATWGGRWPASDSATRSCSTAARRPCSPPRSATSRATSRRLRRARRARLHRR